MPTLIYLKVTTHMQVGGQGITVQFLLSLKNRNQDYFTTFFVINLFLKGVIQLNLLFRNVYFKIIYKYFNLKNDQNITELGYQKIKKGCSTLRTL